jgi:hypothetical protein
MEGNQDAEISELRRLLKSLLSKYIDACRQDNFYDMAHDSLAEKCQRVLSGESVGLSKEFDLQRRVCRQAVRFSRAIANDDGDDHLEELLNSAEVWEKFMNEQGYTLQ